MMIDLIVAVLIWLIVLLDPYAFDTLSGATPGGCTFYEDGGMLCPAFVLPAYDDVLEGR